VAEEVKEVKPIKGVNEVNEVKEGEAARLFDYPLAHSKCRSLRSVAGAPKFGAKEKTGHSGRDDTLWLLKVG
jgi:hypothetical protein